MEGNVKIEMKLTIEKGRGYVPAEENKVKNSAIGTIFIDSIFTPIRNVKYSIENYRVEQKTDYEKLVLDIDTDGSVHPKEALKELEGSRKLCNFPSSRPRQVPLLLPRLARPRLYFMHCPFEFLDEETDRSSVSIRDDKRAIVPESLALGG